MRLCALVVVPGLGLALAACSGAERQSVEEPPSAEGSGGTVPTSGSGTPGGEGSDASTAGNGSANGNGNGNGHGSGNGGTTFDAGAAPDQCPSGAASQMGQSGNNESDATPFSSSACGTLDVGQTYWWTFTLSPQTTQFGLTFGGHVRIEATVNGATVDVAPGTTLPFDVKHPYDLRVTSSESQAEPYVILVTEN